MRLRHGAVLAALMVIVPVGAACAVESSIGPAGQVILDGEPTVPFAVWVQPAYLFDYHRQLGVQCVFSPSSERGPFADSARDILGAATKHSLGVISRFRGGDTANHPSIWGWMGGYVDPRRPDRVRRNTQRIRGADPTRFVMHNIAIDDFIVGKHAKGYAEAIGNTDAIISHVWPELRDPTTYNIRNVATFVDLVRQYCEGRESGEVSIWVEINPHKWKLKDREGGAEFRRPTLAELRFQIWLALIHGADGICVFPISFDPFVYSQIPATAESEIARNAALIRRMTPALVAEPSQLMIELTSDKPEEILDVTTRQVDGEHYVFVLNGGRNEQTVTLKAPDLGEQWQVTEAVRRKPVRVVDGAVVRKLKGLELAIFHLKPVTQTDDGEAGDD